MNSKLFLAVGCFALTVQLSYSQLLPPPLHQWNKLPAWGKVGIGTITPSEDLHVVGNAKISNILFANTIESSSIASGTLTLSGNALLNGSLGLGVASPTERLDILGNIKLSGNILAQGLSIQSLNSNSGVFNTFTVNQTSFFNGIASFGEDVQLTKNALISGKLGIGMAPTEAIDVVGNIRSNAGLFSLSLNTETAQVSSLDVSGNAIVNGLVGIGVTTPLEKLHIGGNIKVDNSVIASDVTTTSFQTNQFSALGLASFNENVSFQKDLTTIGKIGIGVTTPTESLDVIGNLKLSGDINAASISSNHGSFGQGLNAGNTLINGTLQVSGQLTSQSLSLSDLTASSNVAIGNALTVTGISELTGGAHLGGSSTAINFDVTGQLHAGSTSVSDLNTFGNATVGQDLNVTGAGQIAGNLTVSGQLNANALSLASISSTNSINVGTNLTVNGASELKGGANITGNSAVEGNLQVSGTFNAGTLAINDLNANGNASISQNLLVNGSTQLGGDLNIAGSFRAGIVEATEFRLTGGGSPFNLDNAVITQTPAIATDKPVPTNYKVAVGGNIIAMGIDVKIPQKWPDYVFTDGHKLLSIEEVKTFIEVHGHLPGILSAQEMEQKENYSLPEMDAKLLEKIEELTLYIIELESRLKALEK